MSSFRFAPRLLAAAAAPIALLALACGPAEPANAPGGERVSLASGSPVELYFPLEAGKLYTYATREGQSRGTVSMRVERGDATHGKLIVVGSGTTKRFVYEKDGVAYEGGAYLLKAPLEVGTSWPGEHGGQTKIARVDVSAKAGGKSYESCVETVEDATRPPGVRYTTTYCPGIGMVRFEVVAADADAVGELTSYGAPIVMEPGTKVTVEKNP